MAYAATFIELSSMTLDGEGRDLIKETDERKRKRGSTFEAFRTCPPTHAARINFRDDRPQRFSMSLSLPPLSARGAILVSTSNASRRHSCTPLSSRINDPRSVFSTRTATISGRGQLHNTSEYKSFAPVTVPTLYTRGNVEVTPAILSWINLAQDKFRSNCSLDEKRKRFSKKVARSALRLFIDRSSILLPFLIVRLEKNRKQQYIYIYEIQIVVNSAT